MNQSTIAQNIGVAGGGIVLGSNDVAAGASTSATITQSTITDNTAGASGGGGILTLGASNGVLISILAVNTIIAGNHNSSTSSADDIEKFNVGATYTFDTTGSKNNLIGVDSSGSFTAGNLIIGIANPVLSALGSYGGATETVALLPGSHALDAGDDSVTGPPDSFTTDQRGTGFNRKVGTHVDIGAFESNGFTVSQGSGSGHSASVATGFVSPLVVNVTANNPLEPVGGGIVTFTVNPAGNGAGATPGSTTATISGGGSASITPTANTVAGSYSVTASVVNVPGTATFNLTNIPGPADPAHSIATVGAGTIATNNSTTITLQAVDAFGNIITTGGASIGFGLGAGMSSGTLSGVTDNGNGTYTATFIGSTPGTARTITATIGGVAVTTTLPAITVATGLLDVDDNGKVDPLTDGILILRYMFKFTGSTLTSGAIGAGALRTDPTVITTYLDSIKNTVLDVDANGTASDPLTDGILILRYMFGFTGTTLTSGALSPGSARTSGAQVVSFLDPFNPNGGSLVAAIYTPLNTPTTTTPIPVTIVFNRPVTGLALGDIQVTNGSAGNFVSVGDGNTYMVMVTPSGSGPETVTITVPAAVALDLGGKSNLVSTLSVVFQ